MNLKATWVATKDFFGSIATFVAGLAALVLIFTTIFPALGGWIASWYGVHGYVKYVNRSVDEAGGTFFLLRGGEADYTHIYRGDKLQAGTEVHFREAADPSSRILFVLQTTDCVMVLKTPSNDEKQRASGWLYVSTVACGLFR
jgi:hypothetical protein